MMRGATYTKSKIFEKLAGVTEQQNASDEG